MTEILETIKSSFSWDIGLVIHLATLGYVLGFLFKNQLVLRFIFFISTSFYIIYYYFYPETPLWGAIFGSCCIMFSNLIGTTSILYDRLPFSIDDDYKPIFSSLKGIAPGEFRRLIKVAKRKKVVNEEILLTEELKTPSHLYYLLEGDAIADKNGRQFTIPSGRFVGEISFILKGNKATATTKLNKDSTYLCWEKNELETLLLKEPNLQQAFEAMIARDIASKLSTSHSQMEFQNTELNLA